MIGTAFAIVPFTTAAPPDPTYAPDVEVDAGHHVATYFDGIYMGDGAVLLYGGAPTYNGSYDLTFSNITYAGSRNMTLIDPAGATSPVTTTLSPIGCTTCIAAFPNVKLGVAGMWALRAGDGMIVANVWVGPDTTSLTVTVTPDPVVESSGSVLYTVNVTNSSGPVPNVALRGPAIPNGTTTSANGTWSYFGMSPGAGTHTIEARRQLAAGTTNGFDVPDVVVARSYTVQGAGGLARLSIANVSGSILAPTTVPIVLRNVSDFGSATVTLTVDPNVVTIQGVSNGNIPGANITSSINGSQMTLLITTTARPGASGDFVLANVTLQASGSPGSVSVLDLEVQEMVTSDGAAIARTVTDGSFRAGILGDADGDGDVDAQDVLAIADAVVGNRPMSSIVLEDADVSRDGVVTGKDAMFLRQHLAGTRPTL